MEICIFDCVRSDCVVSDCFIIYYGVRNVPNPLLSDTSHMYKLPVHTANGPRIGNKFS